MFSLANSLSLSRAPLALLFLFPSVQLRVTAILLSMFTDSIDGFIARKRGCASTLGAILDPMMDKFFTLFALIVFYRENRIEGWEMCTILSRDFALLAFSAYLSVKHKWNQYKIGSIIWGKISTTFQFVVLIALAYGVTLPWYVYASFIPMGLLAFLELYARKRQLTPTT